MRGSQSAGRLSAALTLLIVALIPTSVSFAQAQAIASPEVVTIDASAPGHPFPHFWEKMFGSGRAILTLRESYRQDLRQVKKITDFQYVRFHAILHDEVGVYDEDPEGKPVYNFSYVDQIYDGLLANGVRPFVELSFMPKKLAAREMLHPFWYRQNISPPKDWAKWDGLITAFAQHLADRYGIDEVSQWYFEVWNEPNLDFWGGEPKQETYWQLYDHTAQAIKSVSTRFRVGGPATAQAAWVDAFIQHCAANKIPVDFVSTHVYGDDTSEDVFGVKENISREEMVCRAARKVHEQVATSSMPQLPLIWSEFNATFRNLPEITDSSYMGPWLADTIRQCDGMTQVMSYWTFSDVFEEQGVVKMPFYGGYGVIAEDGIPKPAFNAFALLHKLGDQRIAVDSNSVILTRRNDGALVLAIWNYGHSSPDSRITVSLRFRGTQAKQAWISQVDRNHGDVHTAYEAMGSPRYPTGAQIEELRRAAAVPVPEAVPLQEGQLNLSLPADNLTVVEVR